MKIHYLIHYFPPELNGGATRASDLARLWSERGERVTVLTGFPNHPSGTIPLEYRGKLFHEESVDGYQVRRTWIYATRNEGTYKRILNHISLTISSVVGSVLGQRPDIIIASSPPLFLGIAGYLLSRLQRVPLVFEVRDLWPKQAVDLGMITNLRVIQVLERLEMFLYRKAALVVGVTNSTKAKLVERGIGAGKIETIYNATDLDFFQPGAASIKLRAELQLEGKFVISYIGTMGLSQGLMTVLDAAEKMQDKCLDVHFLLVGDGAERSLLIETAKQRKLANVSFLPSQPRQSVPDLYRLSDGVLVLLRNVDLFRSTIPSKIFEIMACGIPLILGVKGEAEGIVRRAEAGICITPESCDELVEAILKLMRTPDLSQKFGNRGRAYVEIHHDRRNLAEQYLQAIKRTINNS